jgi:hypothetical protein
MLCPPFVSAAGIEEEIDLRKGETGRAMTESHGDIV